VKFFLDHDVPADVGRVLRLKGHTVRFLENALPRADDDLSAMRYAAGQGLVIVTCNRKIACGWLGRNPTLASSSWSGADRVRPNVALCCA